MIFVPRMGGFGPALFFEKMVVAWVVQSVPGQAPGCF
jgi:hypothetical protein